MIHELEALKQGIVIRSKTETNPETAQLMKVWAQELAVIIAKAKEPKFDGGCVGQESKI